MVLVEKKRGRIILKWKKESPEEIATVQKTFEEYLRGGWLAFKVTTSNGKKQIFTFDPTAELIYLVPLIEGG